MPQETRLIRSFGRIKSRKLSNHKQDLYDNLLPKYELDQKNQDFLKNQPLFLEIGFGFGDFTFNFAKNNPDINIIAAETHINGIVSLLDSLENKTLNNLKIYKEDVRLLLEELEDDIFDQIYILFPDPWPKSKHYKRRLIDKGFLDILAKKLKKDSKLIIATDHDSYKEWIMSAIIDHENFIWQADKKDDWNIFPDDWTITKYQKKAAREGRNSVYLEFSLSKQHIFDNNV